MIDKVVTSGTFSLDGGTWDVENNVWLVGSAREVIVIDAAHDAGAIADRVGDRVVKAIVCTHAHNDHINAAADLAERVDAPIMLHPADQVLWEMVYPGRPYVSLKDGEVLSAGGVDLTVLHTPGHAPGAVCLYAQGVGAVFAGDTLFKGGPGATGRSYSSFETIIESIRERLLTLPGETAVHTGHGDSTVIAEEAGHLEEWLARGH
ncbi:MBL fold metallo-hydrolase [Streptosporangium lutulentum]|uniref:Glyoxylase-like metal-dependent hydrolase (Beta-lactamase superfamily II) n=1 Tax=Streptosporangium lutulentum TaxID=1461250 RepID=A0ABT9QIF5_9ACTN|nr:MBL fold metallo-hydrolase [Streptosporangium lutulentum]MDP9846537.1 glyoxylase-like metal-dependent hydrolase (beta-lactamase superfamily II) [Streptosporangium lutulentum]